MRYVVVLTLLILPLAAGHGGEPHGPDDGHGDDGDTPTTPEAPAELDPWFTRLASGYWYGRAVSLWTSPTPIQGLEAHDGWVVWESDGDIWALPPSGAAFPLTETDDLREHSPEIHGRYVVYVSQTFGDNRVWLYDLDTGTARAITKGTSRVSEPTVWGQWVAWVDDRHGTSEVYVHDLANGTSWPVALSEARKQNVVLFDGHVAWLEEELNQWDVAVAALPNGTIRHLTRDRDRETPPQTDGKALYWTQMIPRQTDRSRMRFDPVTDTITNVAEPGPAKNPILFLPNNVTVSYRSEAGPLVFYAMNGTTGRLTYVSGRLEAGAPAASGANIYIPIRNATHHVLYLVNVHDYAVQASPVLTIDRPLDGSVLSGSGTARGTYVHSPAWPMPQRLEYRLGRGEWIPFDAQPNWTVPLDPSDLREGIAGFSVRAVYEDAPRVADSLLVNVRRGSSGGSVDLSKAPTFTLQDFVERNPGFFLLVALVLVFAVLLAARLALRRRPRGGFVVEYVRQDS